MHILFVLKVIGMVLGIITQVAPLVPSNHHSTAYAIVHHGR